MYFLRRQAPVELTAERAIALRTSLNSPVVSSPEIPSGPARAAILVHKEPEGAVSVTVGVRSLKSADAATWTCDAELEEPARVDVAVDAALSFAEGMGFLFDDGAPDSGRRAFSGWNGMMGDASESDGVLVLTDLAPIEPDEGSSEPVLDWDDSEDRSELELAGESGFDLTTASFEEPVPSVPLSKFRKRLPTDETGDVAREAKTTGAREAARAVVGQAAANPNPKPAAKPGAKAGGRAALGKLKLIKRRGDAGAARRAWLQRVLSSF